MDIGTLEDVPSFFVCPISLQIMRDPVTISTGMTFDRESIQKWLFHYKKRTCPITRQPLSDFLLTPNSNLRRLIQSWSLKELSPETMKEKTSKEEAALTVPIDLLLEEMKQPHLQVKSLRKMRSLLIKETNIGGISCRRCFRDNNLFSLVSSLVADIGNDDDDDDDHLQGLSQAGETLTLVDEAMSVLCLLKPSEETLKFVSQEKNGLLIKLFCSIMERYSSFRAKIQAALLLKSIFKVVDGIYKAGLNVGFLESLTEILKDQNSKQGSVAVLAILVEVLSFGKNKEKAIKGGIIPVLVELLAEDNKERRICEMMLVVLEKLCKKAEGREAFLAHPVGMAAVLSKVLRVSQVGNDRAVSLFLWVFRFCKRSEVALEFMEVGGVTKIRTLVQSGCRSHTKYRAREILGFHLKEWNNSLCFQPGFGDSDTNWR